MKISHIILSVAVSLCVVAPIAVAQNQGVLDLDGSRAARTETLLAAADRVEHAPRTAEAEAVEEIPTFSVEDLPRVNVKSVVTKVKVMEASPEVPVDTAWVCTREGNARFCTSRTFRAAIQEGAPTPVFITGAVSANAFHTGG